MPTDPTPDEIARVKCWAAMQNPPVTVEKCNRASHLQFKLQYIPSCLFTTIRYEPPYPSPDAAWSALAIAMREPFASIGPVIAAEFAARLEGVLCPQCDAQIAKDE